MSVKAVMFDFDGTLANTNPLIIKCFQHTYRVLKNEYISPEDIEKYFGEPLGTSMAWRFGENKREEAMDIYRSFHAGRFDKLIEPFPGMDGAVKDLKKAGFLTALVTSRLKETTITGVEGFGLLEWFDCITTVDKLTKHKPDPEAILVTLEDLGVGPEEAVMIGDSKYDILCAKNAGCRSILVDWSVTGPEERAELSPDFVAKDAKHLLEIIKGM